MLIIQYIINIIWYKSFQNIITQEIKIFDTYFPQNKTCNYLILGNFYNNIYIYYISNITNFRYHQIRVYFETDFGVFGLVSDIFFYHGFHDFLNPNHVFFCCFCFGFFYISLLGYIVVIIDCDFAARDC